MAEGANIPQSFDELVTVISSNYPKLSRRLQQIAHYALANPNEIALETIAIIAQRASVQPSSLIRFAKTFGYGGFSGMQRIFRDRLMQNVPTYGERIRELRREGPPLESILGQFAEASIHAVEHLRRETSESKLTTAVNIMTRARTVYVAAQRRSFPAAAYMSYLLSHLDRPVSLIDGIGGLFFEQLRSVRKNDALVVISFHDYSEDVVEAADQAHKKGIPILAITDNKLSPLASLATVCLEVEEAQVGHFRSLSATMCLILSLAVALGARPRNGTDKL